MDIMTNFNFNENQLENYHINLIKPLYLDQSWAESLTTLCLKDYVTLKV